MKLTQIADFIIGRSIQGFYLCREKHIRHTRKGDIYVDLVLSDATGNIFGKMWEHIQEFSPRFKNGDPVAVKGKVTEYKEQIQLTVTQINYADKKRYGKYGFSPDLLITSIKESPEDLWKNLCSIIDTLAAPYNDLISAIYTKNIDIVKQLPGSAGYYHAMRGGFLKHTLNTALLCQKILPVYPQLDYNLCMSGILLYNVGKLKSISTDLIPNYTDNGKLIGQAVLGRDILKEAAQSVQHFPKEIELKLEHIILSHNEMLEKGSSIEPLFPEALFVHYVDGFNC